jgi:hypothetical protein
MYVPCQHKARVTCFADKGKDDNPWVGRRRNGQAGDGKLPVKTEGVFTPSLAPSVPDHWKRRMNRESPQKSTGLV